MERIASRLQQKIAEQAVQYVTRIVMLEDELEELKKKHEPVSEG